MKFIATFSFSSFVLFSLLYGFIISVDPYNKLGNNLFGFETKAVDFARENKFNQVEHSKKRYQAFILGSSAAHRYETKELEKLTGFKTYNYAVQSTTPEDYLAILRHILSRQKPRLIVLSLDFYGLNEHYKTDDMFYSSPLKNYLTGVQDSPKEEVEDHFFKKSYVTISALNDSFKVVWVNLFGNAQHTYLEDGNHVYTKPKINSKVEVRQYNYPNYEISQRRIHYLKEFKSIADQNNVKLVVFTAPLSYDHILKIEQDPYLIKQLESFKRAALDIFGEIHDFNSSAMMIDYNSSEYFLDSGHPTFEFSTTILKSLFTKEPVHSNFGKKLTKDLILGNGS